MADAPVGSPKDERVQSSSDDYKTPKAFALTDADAVGRAVDAAVDVERSARSFGARVDGKVDQEGTRRRSRTLFLTAWRSVAGCSASLIRGGPTCVPTL